MFIEIVEELTIEEAKTRQPMIVRLNVKGGNPQQIMDQQELKFVGRIYKKKMWEGEISA